MGIVVGAKGFVSFEVDETQESWPAVQRWISAKKPVDIVTTKFSKQEIADAAWLELMPDWHHGYPQPDEDVFGYRAATYDLSNYCAECGTGMKQRAPFRMKAEPKWGRNEILQLNWVFDEYFVTPALWTKVFEPFGIAHREVLGINGQALKSVVQLSVDQETDVVADGLETQKCPECGRTKFVPVMRGAFPALAREPTSQMARTVQYFGSDKMASKRIVISRKLADALEGVHGASVRPVTSAHRRHFASDAG